MFEKLVNFMKANKDLIFKGGVVLLLGAAGAVLFGQLASDESESESGESTEESTENSE